MMDKVPELSAFLILVETEPHFVVCGTFGIKFYPGAVTSTDIGISVFRGTRGKIIGLIH